MWQGLGYYSRARNLHAAARQIIEKFGGRFPTNYTDIHSLKGVGDYTASAIASFAYNAPYAVLDGNVYRVLSRMLDDETPIDTTYGKKHFQECANQLLDTDNSRVYNQAVMELGAICCTPLSPQCARCPVNTLCKAHLHNTVRLLPVKQRTTLMRDRYFNHLIYIYNGQTLLQRREGEDIWKHLYEFPLIESASLLDSSAALEAFEAEQARVVRFLDLTHVLSHQRIHARFFVLNVKALPMIEGTQKVSVDTLSDYPLSRLTMRALEQLLID